MTDPRDLIKRLADALHDAADDVEGWGNYASSYFQEKHDLSGNVAKIHAQADEARAYLAQPEPEGVEDLIAKLEAELERERLRLAACGVVAMADTPESAAKARDMSPEYHSASLADVIRQIDALMELRAYLAQPEPEELSHETAARNAVESCLAQREEVLEAFIAKHGFCPDEAIQIEQRLEDGSSTWRIERRAALTQPEPEGPTEEEMETDFLCWYKDRYSTAYFGAVPLAVLIAWTQFVLARSGRLATTTTETL